MECNKRIQAVLTILYIVFSLKAGKNYKQINNDKTAKTKSAHGHRVDGCGM